MGYKSATNVLPGHLVREIQKYIDSEYLYIPSYRRKACGSKNGTEEKLVQRDNKIYQDFKNDVNMNRLSNKYCMSIKSIEKIISTQKTGNLILRKWNS